jgi:hypothetical protein
LSSCAGAGRLRRIDRAQGVDRIRICGALVGPNALHARTAKPVALANKGSPFVY